MKKQIQRSDTAVVTHRIAAVLSIKCHIKAFFILLLALMSTSGWGQNVTVAGALAGNGSYPTLAAAFTAINGGAQTNANITITITGNTTEPTVASHSANLNAGTWTSITIQPSGARTIQGAATADMALIRLFGADNVTINGLNAGGNSLTISNTTTGAITALHSTATILFSNDATNNIITNCTVLGSGTGGTSASFAFGVIAFGNASTTGNDNNTISNCNIGPAGANLPCRGITSSGSSGATERNSGITINNNNIYDFFSASLPSSGVMVTNGCVGWSITNNRFYQTAQRTFSTAGVTHRAIDLQGTSTTFGVEGMTVTGNTIGFSGSGGTGTYDLTGSSGKFQGIYFNGKPGGTVSDINSNIISSVSLTGVTSAGTGSTVPFAAIFILTGVVNTNNNAIESLNFSTNIASTTWIVGINNQAPEDWQCNNNTIGGITATNIHASGQIGFYAVRCSTADAKTFTCSGNTIGGATAGNISITTPSTSGTTWANGITNNLGIGNISNNVVRNMTTNVVGGTAAAASLIGINITTTGANQTISLNQIYGLHNSNTTAATVVTGIQFTGSTDNLVERNFIYGLTSSTTSTSAGAEVNGIRVIGGTTTFRNNMIAIGAGISIAFGGAVASASTAGINGVLFAAGSAGNFWNNSIYIGGTATSGTGASFAFNGTETTNPRSFINNIFVNARSSGAANTNLAAKINGTAGLTMNENIFFTPGTGGVLGHVGGFRTTLALWQANISGQDAQSQYGDPLYLAPASATPDLHITNLTSIANATGVNMGVINDFDNEIRSTLSPVDIGADAFATTALPVELISFTANCNESGDQVDVHWATASEHNSSHFAVERSVDGIAWQNLNSTAAAGNSTTLQEYAFLDSAARGFEIIYYRLVQFDNDGAYEVFGPVSVQCDHSIVSHSVFPNPNSGAFTLELANAEKSSVTYTVQIHDGQGKELYNRKYEVENGFGKYLINLPEFAQGIYYLKISDDNKNQIFKLLVR